MANIRKHEYDAYRFRAKLPKYIRNAAIGVFVIAVLVVVVGFYRESGSSGFRLKGEHTQLSEEVVAVGDNYERLESEGDRPKYLIRADHVKTFSDKHQELTNIYLETYDDAGQPADRLTAAEALYVPEEDKNFTAYLKGRVEINSRDRLNVKTENIVYTRSDETVDADQTVTFERDNIRGRSSGALVKIGLKRVELLKDVEIESFDSPELKSSGVRYAKIVAASAIYDQLNNKVEAVGNVNVELNTASSSAAVDAGRAVATLTGDGIDPNDRSVNGSVRQIEFFDNVRILAKENGSSNRIEAGYVRYEKLAQRYELKQGGHIVTDSQGDPTDIRANEIMYDEGQLNAALSGSAEIQRGSDYLSGDTINAALYPDKKPRFATARGDALVRQKRDQDTISLRAPELNATFSTSGSLKDANSVGRSTAELIPASNAEYSSAGLTATDSIAFAFAAQGVLSGAKTRGRSTLLLNARPGTDDAANKRVTADSITTELYDGGKFIRHASAIGNAELFIDPLQAAADNFRTTVTAPRFDCEFYPTGNNARRCTGGKKTKTVRERTVTIEGTGTQTLLADELIADFDEANKKPQTLDAVGNAKFTELDRSALASRMTYTEGDSTVRLRGGEPTIWNGRSRAKANEIDWNTSARHSYLRGSVSATYYSQKSSGGSLPFASEQKPVFVTSDNAEFDHVNESANFVGNARGWQDDNYVRADRFYVIPAQERFRAEGNVQSALYDARQSVSGKSSKIPVFVSSNSLDYEGNSHLIRYVDNVDIRQGTDRITAGKADVYLKANNEFDKAVAESKVVITQPGRKAIGDWAQYTADDEVAMLRGSPAIVTDSTNGNSRAGELVFNMRTKHVASQGKTSEDPTARTRTVYNINPD